MSAISGISGQSMMLEQLRDMQAQAKSGGAGDAGQNKLNSQDTSFTDLLKEELNKVSEQQKSADKMAADLATGEGQSLHETMLEATKAELSFNLMVGMRNKMLEAYQEVMRMQV